jgi:hypothetical protein
MNLQGMTQERWNALSPHERESMQALGCLTPQLVGLEGWRVEVTDEGGNKWRFIVARSTGWQPQWNLAFGRILRSQLDQRNIAITCFNACRHLGTAGHHYPHYLFY